MKIIELIFHLTLSKYSKNPKYKVGARDTKVNCFKSEIDCAIEIKVIFRQYLKRYYLIILSRCFYLVLSNVAIIHMLCFRSILSKLALFWLGYLKSKSVNGCSQFSQRRHDSFNQNLSNWHFLVFHLFSMRWLPHKVLIITY